MIGGYKRGLPSYILLQPLYGPQPEQYGPFPEDFKPGGKYYDDSNDTASESYLEWGVIAAGVVVGVKTGVANLGVGGTATFNFAKKAAMHMAEKGRYVPIQILSEAIKHGTAKPDPQGTNATMYYIEMIKNGAKYTLEALYDEVSNTIYHFLYK